MDQLDTQSHVTQLRSTLTQLDGELKVKDKLVEKYEIEIRQRNDDIDKKMYRYDTPHTQTQRALYTTRPGP